MHYLAGDVSKTGGVKTVNARLSAMCRVYLSDDGEGPVDLSGVVPTAAHLACGTQLCLRVDVSAALDLMGMEGSDPSSRALKTCPLQMFHYT